MGVQFDEFGLENYVNNAKEAIYNTPPHTQ